MTDEENQNLLKFLLQTTNPDDNVRFERGEYQKILWKMPLRAEYVSVGILTNLAELYRSSLVNRFKYNIPQQMAVLTGAKRYVTAVYEHIDPLTITFRGLTDFFMNRPHYRRFLLGRKGTGKTFNTLLALNYTIQHSRKNEFKPCYITFDVNKKVPYIKNPHTYATQAQWANSGVQLPFYRFFEEWVDWANVIIFDELHYFIEYLIHSGANIEPFINLIQKVLDRKCQVLFISENILLSYAEQLKNAKFNNICQNFGNVSSYNNPTQSEKIDYLSLREISGLTRSQIKLLDSLYDLDCDPFILDYLVKANCPIRGLLKLLKIIGWKSLSIKNFSEAMNLDDCESKEFTSLVELHRRNTSSYLYNPEYTIYQQLFLKYDKIVSCFIHDFLAV